MCTKTVIIVILNIMLRDEILLNLTVEKTQRVYCVDKIMFLISLRSEQDILALENPKLVKPTVSYYLVNDGGIVHTQPKMHNQNHTNMLLTICYCRARPVGAYCMFYRVCIWMDIRLEKGDQI